MSMIKLLKRVIQLRNRLIRKIIQQIMENSQWFVHWLVRGFLGRYQFYTLLPREYFAEAKARC